MFRGREYLTESLQGFFLRTILPRASLEIRQQIEDAKDKGSLRRKDLFQRNVTKPRDVIQFTLRPRDFRPHKGSVNRVIRYPGPLKRITSLPAVICSRITRN